MLINAPWIKAIIKKNAPGASRRNNASRDFSPDAASPESRIKITSARM
jgi:hypothetical protein